MKISLDSLLVLDGIARKGSFAAAAEKLRRAPSAITYTVTEAGAGPGREVVRPQPPPGAADPGRGGPAERGAFSANVYLAWHPRDTGKALKWFLARLREPAVRDYLFGEAPCPAQDHQIVRRPAPR